MTNREFFIQCLKNELKSTVDVIQALNDAKMDHRPHPNSRSAYEIAEHIIAHAYDFDIILKGTVCDECLNMKFANAAEGSKLLSDYWQNAISTAENTSEEDFNNINVELLVSGKSFVTIPRGAMLWFFLFDVIHHRGQLSTYIRPMGGKNPAVYGYSFDTM